jgi:hypothetical protein
MGELPYTCALPTTYYLLLGGGNCAPVTVAATNGTNATSPHRHQATSAPSADRHQATTAPTPHRDQATSGPTPPTAPTAPSADRHLRHQREGS